jgi:hypothetical protein
VIFALVKNGIWASSFAPCADDHSLLKGLAVAEKRAVARRVLLYLTGSLKRIDLNFSSNPHRVSFKRRLINMITLIRHGVLRGETSLRKTQQHNLNTKGRNQRQINE